MSVLNIYQEQVIKECVELKSGSMSLPMGYGKTRTSIALGLEQSRMEKILIIASKSLISNWVSEMNDCFPEIGYQILHGDHTNISDFEIKEDTRVVITTPQMIVKSYKLNGIDTKFAIKQIISGYPPTVFFEYSRPDKPYSTVQTGVSVIHSIKWGVIIIDEIQQYLNHMTAKCRGVSSICTNFRWGLSGTVIDDPSADKVLGYYLLINNARAPRNIIDIRNLVNPVTGIFRGIRDTLVMRTKIEDFDPKSEVVIVSHTISREERLIYEGMKVLCSSINKKLKNVGDDKKLSRKYASKLLTMITILRQCIISPLIPISSMAIGMLEYDNKSELAREAMNVINNLNITGYFDDPRNMISSRFKNVLGKIEHHSDEKIVCFTSFRTTIDFLINIIPNRRILTITGSMSLKKRDSVLSDFKDATDNPVLLLTYTIGGEGLNLQSCSTVLLIDYWWNSAKTTQSIARVLRRGQTKKVNIYHFTSNTAIEEVIFDKHKSKNTMVDVIINGGKYESKHKFSVKDILRIIDLEKNVVKISDLYN